MTFQFSPIFALCPWQATLCCSTCAPNHPGYVGCRLQVQALMIAPSLNLQGKAAGNSKVEFLDTGGQRADLLPLRQPPANQLNSLLFQMIISHKVQVSHVPVLLIFNFWSMQRTTHILNCYIFGSERSPGSAYLSLSALFQLSLGSLSQNSKHTRQTIRA